MIKGSIYKENIIIPNIYTPKKVELKIYEAKTNSKKEESNFQL